MKQMKRAAGLLLALVLVLSMAACGKKDGDGGDSQSGFQRGTIENGIYTNTFAGIGCQLSDDWTYYTDEQLAELSGVVAESSEEMQKAMEDGKSTYDMFASAMEGLVTINVVYEDLGALYGKLLDDHGADGHDDAADCRHVAQLAQQHDARHAQQRTQQRTHGAGHHVLLLAQLRLLVLLLQMAP